MIREILQKPEANAFFSFVIGVGLAALMFHRAQTSYVVSALPVDQIASSITKLNGKCWRFRVTDASAPGI